MALFREHVRRLGDYTDALREGRCRRTRHFSDRLLDTMQVFRPLFQAWNMEILFALYMHGPSRFNRLKATLDPVSSRVLTDKLRGLVALDLIQHVEKEYALTPHGEVTARHLHPLLFLLHNRDVLLSEPAPVR